jgi:putative membrane protein
LGKLWNNGGGISFALIQNPHFSRKERARDGAPGETVDQNLNSNPNRARDHLANERTFLAWVRTGAAIVVFGFAIGRFSIAMRQLTALEGHSAQTAGMSVWMGSSAILAGVGLVVAGLVRYRKTRVQLDAGTFEPAGIVLDLITVLMVVFGLVLAGYLIYTEKILG